MTHKEIFLSQDNPFAQLSLARLRHVWGSGELLVGAKLIRLGDNMAIPLRSFRLGPA